jgi:hypothetical protein
MHDAYNVKMWLFCYIPLSLLVTLPSGLHIQKGHICMDLKRDTDSFPAKQ